MRLWSALVLFVWLVIAGSGTALGLTITSPFNISENRGPNSVGLSAGHQVQVGANSIDPAGPPTTASATQGATTVALSFFPFTIFPGAYVTSLPFNAALTGAWTLNVTREADVAAGLTNPIPNPQVLPLVSNLRVDGSGSTPTVRWELPSLVGFDVDIISVVAWDDGRVVNTATGTNDQVFIASPVPLATTEFAIPPGVLQNNRPYIFEVRLIDFGFLPAYGSFIENRSRAFTQTPYIVPDAASLVLLATGLSALGGAAVIRRRHP